MEYYATIYMEYHGPWQECVTYYIGYTLHCVLKFDDNIFVYKYLRLKKYEVWGGQCERHCFRWVALSYKNYGMYLKCW
jgi:hypothetical protein